MNSKKFPLTATKARFLRRRYKALYQAIEKNAFAEVESLLYGIDINQPLLRAHTPLIAAVVHRHQNLVVYLLEQGADINFYNRYHDTALSLAIILQDKVLTALLYDRGAALDTFEHMALRNAVSTENNAFIAFVLTQGIDADSRFENEQTVLMAAARNACESGNLNPMRMLLAYGADINAVDTEGRSVLQCALLRTDDTDACHVFSVVDYCLECGADPNQRDGYSSSEDSLLHTAVCEQNLALTQILLRHGANPNILNTLGNSPLQALLEDISLGLIEVPSFTLIETLLKHGAQTNRCNHDNNTALELAHACEDNALLALLLRYSTP